MPSVTLADVLKRFNVDDRLTLCDVWQKPDASIAGFVEMPQYRDVLKKAGFDVSQVKLMPEEGSTPDRFGIVTVDHAILRKFPEDRPGEHDNATDVTRDEFIWILDRHADGATLVHSGDGYLGWVDAAALRAVGGEEAANWRANESKGDHIERIDRSFFRTADVIKSSKYFLGAPYLWGGKTPDGIDCSGLVQTSFAKHGIFLPRDADQQANVGRLVATRWFKDALLPGDLLFFMSPQRGRITHVAINLGAGKYIEAAGKDVHIRSMTPGDADYDAERAATFAWARRVIE